MKWNKKHSQRPLKMAIKKSFPQWEFPSMGIPPPPPPPPPLIVWEKESLVLTSRNQLLHNSIHSVLVKWFSFFHQILDAKTIIHFLEFCTWGEKITMLGQGDYQCKQVKNPATSTCLFWILNPWIYAGTGLSACRIKWKLNFLSIRPATIDYPPWQVEITNNFNN